MAIGPVTVTFTSNDAALVAGARRAEAVLNNLAVRAAAMSASFTAAGNTGAAVLAASLRNMEAEAKRTTNALEQMGAEVTQVGAAANSAHGGVGRISQELIVLAHEASQGRFTRLGGSLVVLAEYAGPVAAGFALANPLIAAAGVAAIAAGAALAYFAYQVHETNTAISGIQLAAAENGFNITREAASKALEAIEKFGNLGPADAKAVSEAFASLGPAGESFAAIASQYIPLFVAQGKTAAEAAKQLAESFVSIDTKGKVAIENSRNLSDEEKRQGLAFIEAGDKVGAYNIVLLDQARSMESVESHARAAKAAQDENVAAMAAGAITGGDLGLAMDTLASFTSEATKQMEANRAELEQWNQTARTSIDVAQRLSSAMVDALKVDKVSAGILDLEGKVKEFEDNLSNAKDPATITQLGRSLDIARAKLKQFREESSDGIIGRDSLKKAQDDNQLLNDTRLGPQSGVLRKQRDNLQGVADKAIPGSREELDAQKAVAAKTNEIREAENREADRLDEVSIAAAGKNSARKIAILESEVQRKTAAFGKGSPEELEGEDKLARAKEQAANRGASAAKQAAKDELADEQTTIQGQIAAVKEASELKIQTIKDEIQLKSVTETKGTADILAELAEQKSAVDALYANEISLAGQKAAKVNQITNQQASYNAKNALQVLAAQEAAAKKTEQAWESATKSINSAFDSQINGLLSGTETWHKAFTNVVKDLTEQLLKFGINKVLEGGENIAKGAFGIGKVGSDAAGNAGLITSNATLMGSINALTIAMGGAIPATVANTAVTGASAGATAANTGSSLLNTISTDANTIATNFQAAVAAIGHLFGFAEGTPLVQQTGLALIHQGEMIVPSHLNPNNVGNSLGIASGPSSSASSGGGDIYHSHNWGGVIVNNTGGELDPENVVKALNQAVQGGHHLQYNFAR